MGWSLRQSDAPRARLKRTVCLDQSMQSVQSLFGPTERERLMTPGPTIIRKCSACGKLIAQHTISSGNTCGARFWTDGKRDAPMLPDQPWLVKCQHCGAVVWIDEQEQVGEIDPWGPRDQDVAKFREALPYASPSTQDYLAGLAKGISDKQKERYLRLRAWWAGNDQRRQEAHAEPMSNEEISNLRAFAPLLDETNENDRITKAEVMRELGMFTEAKALLSNFFSKELSQAVAIIRNLTKQQISSVREMKFR